MTTTYTYSSQQPRISSAYETSIVGQPRTFEASQTLDGRNYYTTSSAIPRSVGQPRTFETSQTLDGRNYYTTSSAIPRSVGYTYQTAPTTRVVSEGAAREVILNRSIQGAPATTYRDGSSAYRVIHDPLASYQSTIQQPVQRIEQPIQRTYTTQEAPVSTRSYYTTRQAYQPRGIHRPFLGFGMRTNAQLKHSGLQCDLVWDQGPARAAGIQLEDEIIAIGNSGERLTSLKQAQQLVEREAQVGGTIRIVGRRGGSGELYETPLRVMSRDAGAGIYYFNAEGKTQETLDKPLSRKNSLYNPNATRHDDVLSQNRVRPSTSALASEAALGSARNSGRLYSGGYPAAELSGRLSSAGF